MAAVLRALVCGLAPALASGSSTLVFSYTGREFSGATDDYDDLSSSSTGLVFQDAISIGFRARFDRVNPWAVLTLEGATSNVAVWIFSATGTGWDQFRFMTMYGGGDSTVAVDTVSPGETNDYLLTASSAGAIQIVKDGAVIASGTSGWQAGSGPWSPTRLLIGRLTDSDRVMDGEIEYLMIWNGVLDWDTFINWRAPTPQPTPAPTPSPTGHLSLAGKTASHSSGSCDGSPPSLAIDTDASTCSCTYGHFAYWQVDLGRTYSITKVRVAHAGSGTLNYLRGDGSQSCYLGFSGDATSERDCSMSSSVLKITGYAWGEVRICDLQVWAAEVATAIATTSSLTTTTSYDAVWAAEVATATATTSSLTTTTSYDAYDSWQPRCISHACPTHFLKIPSPASVVGQSDEKCCVKSCGNYNCPQHYRLKSSARSMAGQSTAACCDRTCSGYACPADHILVGNAANVTVFTESTCCERSCKDYSCGDRFVLKPNATSLRRSEGCCQDEAALLQQAQAQVLPRCACSSNSTAGSSSGTTANSTGVVACETGAGAVCGASELYGCFIDATLCEVRGPYCQPGAGFSGATLGQQCARHTAESDCSVVQVCQWSGPDKLVNWQCTSADPGVPFPCVSNSSYDCSVTQVGCAWRPHVRDQALCDRGEYVPCAEKYPEQRGQCRGKRSQPTCLGSPLCEWRPTEQHCECPHTHFGSRCEKEAVLWDPHDGLCPKNQAHMGTCAGVVLGAAGEADKDRVPPCDSLPGCASWTRVKRLCSTLSWTGATDILNDVGSILCSIIIAVSVRTGNPERARVLRTPAMIFMFVFFCLDITLEIMMLVVANQGKSDLEALVESFCFSIGDGYDAVKSLWDTVGEMAVNSIVMAALAIFGSIADGIPAVAEALEIGKIDEGITLLSLLMSCGAALGELIYAVYDFVANSRTLVDGLEAIERSVLNVELLEKGHVCMRRHPDLPPAEPTPVTDSLWFGISPALPLCMVAILIVSMLVSTSCILGRSPAKTAKISPGPEDP